MIQSFVHHTEVPERYRFPRRRKTPPTWMHRSANGCTFKWPSMNPSQVESETDSDGEGDELPDLPENNSDDEVLQ